MVLIRLAHLVKENLILGLLRLALTAACTVPATVHGDDGAGDEGGGTGREVEDGPGHLRHHPHALHRMQCSHMRKELGMGIITHILMNFQKLYGVK